MSDDPAAFVAPRFNPDETLSRLKRELRDMGLTERAGIFERRGTAIVKLAVAGDLVNAAIVKRPSRSSPEWTTMVLKDSAQARSFSASLKTKLASWSDRDD